MFSQDFFEKAYNPIRLVGAGKACLSGGRQVVKCSVKLPVFRRRKGCKDGFVTVNCLHVTIHIASVGPRVILGYPSLARYGLTLSPKRGTLVFDEMWDGKVLPDEPPPAISVNAAVGESPIVHCVLDED